MFLHKPNIVDSMLFQPKKNLKDDYTPEIQKKPENWWLED